MATSIIIVSYNTKKLLDNCIESIYKTQKGEYEIIVVDNNSKDGSTELSVKYPNVHWIINCENKGFGYANNQGVRVSSYENIWLLNSDTILEKNILPELELFMQEHPNCGGISPSILYADKSPQITYGNFPTILYYWLNACSLIRLLPHTIKSKLLLGLPVYFKDVKEVSHIVGVSMFIRKSAFNKVNGFDENFFLYFEETDLCDRMRKAGYSFYVLPYIYVLHLLSKSSPTSFFKIKHLLRSRIYYFKKRNAKAIWSLYLLSVFKLLVLSIRHCDFKYLRLYSAIK